MRGRKGMIVGGMALLLVLGCNNGAIEELEKKNQFLTSISNLRKGFLDIFTSFGDVIGGVLGFSDNTKKSDVGDYFGRLGEAVQSVKGKLEGIKGNDEYNSIKEKADSVIDNAIGILEKLANGANKIKEATNGAGDKIGGHDSDAQDAAQADAKSVQGLVAGINMIYEAATKDAKIEAKGKASQTIANSGDVGKLFGQQSSVSDVNGLKAANVALNKATGADILAAIEAVKDKTDSAAVITNAKNAYEIAIATNSSTAAISDSNLRTNASAIAAGLALRAMAQGGKLVTKATSTYAPQEGVRAVLSRAASKTVNEIISIIRRTVDKCLKDVNDCIREGSNSEVKSK